MAHIDATATHDGRGNVTLAGCTATHDGAGNVALTSAGAVIAEDEISLSLVDTSEYDEGISDAAKTATDYLSFTSNGLVVGDMKNGTLKGNVLIDSDSVDVRNGTTVLATFDASKARIGAESGKHAVVDTDGFAFKDGTSKVFDVVYNSNDVWLRTDLKRSIALRPGFGECILRVNENHVQISSNSEVPLVLSGSAGLSLYAAGYKVLWSNTSGTTGTISDMSDSAANFKFLEIHYTDGTRNLSRRVYSPDGKTVSIDRMVYGGGTFYMGAMVLTISGKSITRVTANCGIASVNASGNAVNAEAAQLPITAVIGYR